MRQNNPTILITAETDDSLLQQITSKDIPIDVIPFIRTEIIQTQQLQIQIEDVLQLKTAVVFTSINAVEAVSKYLHSSRPNWNIYSTGNTTKKSIEKIFGNKSITATADDATTLAKKIIANKEAINEVYFFCGDKKRNELPDLLREHNIILNEIEVYTTTILAHKINKDYDAVLFFSPSAVEGFFQNNTISEQTVLFAIGNTTANEIEKFSNNEVVISDKPGKKELIEKMISFFEH
jgi:uroporphyrinogen-III synthase